MSNTSLPVNPDKLNRKNLQPFIAITSTIVAVLISAFFLLDKPLTHYPEVVMQAGDEVLVAFLQQPHTQVSQCEAVVRKLADAMKTVCPECAIVEQHCIQKLSPRQKRLLDGVSVDVPVIRLPNGVVTFEAADPAIAELTCKTSEQQAGGNHKCASPAPAKLTLALAELSDKQIEFPLQKATLAKITLFVALISFLACAFIIWSERWHGRFSHDAIDSGPQKFHAVAVPRIGGLAIACAIGASIAGLTFSGLLKAGSVEGFVMLALAALPAFAGGIAEDLTKKVGVLARLLLTMSAGVLASILVGATLIRLDIPGLDNLLQYWPLFAIAFTAFAVGGVANAFNIIDGYNGLASSFAMLSLCAFAWLAHQVGDHVVLIASLTMLGALIGFFFWNWPVGRLFMGDGGAYLVGFWLAELGILLVVRNPEISPWCPLLVMAYPVWETLYSIYRRKRRIGEPDNKHFHQMIFRRLIREMPSSGSNIKMANTKVLPRMAPWLIAPPLFAVFFPDNTLVLIAAVAVFCCAYVWMYQRLDVGT